MRPTVAIDAKVSPDSRWEATARQYLTTFERPGKIDDSLLRAEFVRQAKLILDHYQQQKMPTGNLANYIAAIEIVNVHLNGLRKTTFGYVNLIDVATSYISAKLKGEEVILPGALGEAEKRAKQDNKRGSDGKIPSLEINSDAERDFVLLILYYLRFFILSKKCKATFDQLAIRAGLILPGLETLIQKRITKYELRIQLYEQSKGEAIAASPVSTSVKDANAAALVVVVEAKVDTNVKAAPPPATRPRADSKAAAITQPQMMPVDFLAFAKQEVIDVINSYIAMICCLNFYGKKRARELINEITECKDIFGFTQTVNTFTRTGKTKSDHNVNNFWRSPNLSSGVGKTSLRTIVELKTTERNNRMV